MANLNFLLLLVFCCPLSLFREILAAAMEQSRSILQFDDLAVSGGMANLSSIYHHLTFSGFNVFEPNNSALGNIISPHDHNCAISRPNALVGSRYIPPNASKPAIASFHINNQSTHRAGLSPYFELVSLWIKPLDGPSPGTSIFIKGTNRERKQEKEWHVEFPSGFHQPLEVKINEFTKELWEGLEKVEIWANFGYESLDWEFCLDDINVRFREAQSEVDQASVEEL